MNNSIAECIIFFVIIIKYAICTDTLVSVRTKLGDVQGYSISSNTKGEHLRIFLGIPYAEPPVGNLRFAKPVEKVPWKPTVLKALKFGASCPQPKSFLRRYSLGNNYDRFDEDCLYLNIYSPTNLTSPGTKYPVMVWIHGGSYKFGSGTEYDGRVLSQKGVVVVTMNYRLGALGFLSTDDNEATGNQGLLDQVLALEWIQQNIESFGGNAAKVTIFGQSAGGGSVSLHTFSPLSRGLFRSVIPQSGCALSPWSIYRPPFSIKTYADELASKLQCQFTSSSATVACLRNKSAQEIAETYIAGPPMIAAFAPRVDGYFITDLPENLLHKGDYNHNISVLTGFVPNESADEIPTNFDNGVGYTADHYRQLMGYWSSRFRNSAAVDKAVLCEYKDVYANEEKYLSLFMEMKSDYGYIIPHILMARKYADAGVFTILYEFDFRSVHYPEPKWMGIIHAAELYYLFGSPFFNTLPCPGNPKDTCPQTWYTYQTSWSDTDRKVSEYVMSFWTGFAKNPKM
ncbi:hypothetical protein FSP39_022366 [Pinctada imbricata]|uniref:Carboxylic ester hydrolase n=1 Tax=Pinctada imbricata TaxID=66713 RepID=A0AA89BL10_PINIB|nr:hypothetical protein FSP39_022366 [Pinctada imbricata]